MLNFTKILKVQTVSLLCRKIVRYHLHTYAVLATFFMFTDVHCETLLDHNNSDAKAEQLIYHIIYKYNMY